MNFDILNHICQFYTPDKNTRRFRLLCKSMSDFSHDNVTHKSRLKLFGKNVKKISLSENRRKIIPLLNAYSHLESLECNATCLLDKENKISSGLENIKCLILRGTANELDLSSLDKLEKLTTPCGSLVLPRNLKYLDALKVRKFDLLPSTLVTLKCPTMINLGRFPSGLKHLELRGELDTYDIRDLKLEFLSFDTLKGTDRLPSTLKSLMILKKVVKLDIGNLVHLENLIVENGSLVNVPKLKMFSGILNDEIMKSKTENFERVSIHTTTDITIKCPTALQIFPVPNVRVINPENLRMLSIIGENCNIISAFINITKLSLYKNIHITDDIIISLFPKLNVLKVFRDTALTGSCFKEIINLTLSRTTIDDNAVLNAGKLKFLKITNCTNINGKCLKIPTLNIIHIINMPHVNIGYISLTTKNIKVNGTTFKGKIPIEKFHLL